MGRSKHNPKVYVGEVLKDYSPCYSITTIWNMQHGLSFMCFPIENGECFRLLASSHKMLLIGLDQRKSVALGSRDFLWVTLDTYFQLLLSLTKSHCFVASYLPGRTNLAATIDLASFLAVQSLCILTKTTILNAFSIF